MRVLILGGTVFIGRAIVAELAASGHTVCVVHRGVHEPDDMPPVRHIHVSRDELGSVAADLRSFSPDAVIDCLAMTRRDAEQACEVIKPGPRLIVLSSADVYRAYEGVLGRNATDPVPLGERAPLRDERYPLRHIGMTEYDKLDVEAVFEQRDATILRLPIVYGERDPQRRHEALLRRVRAGRKRIPVGSGMWLASRAWVGDVAVAVRLVVERPQIVGTVINIAESVTAAEGLWAEWTVRAAGSDAELVRVPDEALPADLGLLGAVPQHLLLDASKARRLLGWLDSDPREALQVSVEWHMANPAETADDDFSADDTALERALNR